MDLLLLLSDLIAEAFELFLISLQRLESLLFLFRNNSGLTLKNGQFIALWVILTELFLHLRDNPPGVHHLRLQNHKFILSNGWLG